MKQRLLLVFGNKVFEKDEKSAEKIGRIVSHISKKYEIVLFYDRSYDIGDSLSLSVKNAFIRQGKNQRVATINSKVLVDKSDPNWRNPTAFSGPALTYLESLKLAKREKMIIRKDKNGNFRRTVPELTPIDLVEKREISDLLSKNTIVIVSGEQPVYKTKAMKLLKFADAKTDRDATAEKLAEILKADVFVSVTDVGNLHLNHEKDNEIKLKNLTIKESRRYREKGHFSPETIGKKVIACENFAKKKKIAIICSLNNLEEAINGKSGTIFS